MVAVKNVDIEDTILNAEEAGKMFGVEASAMYKKAKSESFPSHKDGRRVFFLKSELIAYIRSL